MRASFVDQLRGHCFSAKSLFSFDGTCVGVHQKHVNIKSAIIMAGTMISCSTAILAAKSRLQILHLRHQKFHMRFCRKMLRANGGFDPESKLGTLLKTKLLKLNENRLSVCRLKCELNYSQKSAKKCTFYGCCFKNKGHQIFKCWDLVVACPPIKISGYAPVRDKHHWCSLRFYN